MALSSDDEEDQPVVDIVSNEDGVRTYLYTKFELVTVRGLRPPGPRHATIWAARTPLVAWWGCPQAPLRPDRAGMIQIQQT